MLEALDGLRGTDQSARATAHDVGLAGLLIDFAQGFRAADRADEVSVPVARKHERLSAIGALLEQDLEHLRDDVAGALHGDGVADAHVLAGDLVFVVQRGVGDHDAADGDRMQFGHRGERTGAPDLDLDRLHAGGGALGREFVRHRPARTARNEAEPALQGEIVDLVDDAVDVVAEIGAAGLDSAVMRQQFRRRVAEFRQRVDRQAEALERLDRAVLGLRERRADLAPTIGEEFERPLGGDAGIELAQGARRRVARVGEARFAGGDLARVDRLEILVGENLRDLLMRLRLFRRDRGEIPAFHRTECP